MTETNDTIGYPHGLPEWKRRQAIQTSRGRYIEPTLPERINRLNPSERAQLSSLIRSLKLRKIIRRTLAEAFWDGEAQKLHDAASVSMAKLRAAGRSAALLQSYERGLTASGATTEFELTETNAHQPTILEIPHA